MPRRVAEQLISRHWLSDSTKIGAQILLECLDRDVLPFNIVDNAELCEVIQTYVRVDRREGYAGGGDRENRRRKMPHSNRASSTDPLF
ncbi:unnamed protein product [Caenorhabditis sp. 36 PRJEB53466]|nr:unnamed protein product [Caenorhabditis sp. 36 PRJEB53466]